MGVLTLLTLTLKLMKMKLVMVINICQEFWNKLQVCPTYQEMFFLNTTRTLLIFCCDTGDPRKDLTI